MVFADNWRFLDAPSNVHLATARQIAAGEFPNPSRSWSTAKWPSPTARRALRSGRPGQVQRDHGSLARAALNRHGAVVQFGLPAGDRKAHAGPLLVEKDLVPRDPGARAADQLRRHPRAV